MRQLAERVTDRLEACLGSRLQGVRYWLLSGEAECNWDYWSDDSFLGGEVALSFSNDTTIIVTWEEQNVWPDHCSVQVRSDTAFYKDSLVATDASCLPVWRPLIGSLLQSASVYGWNATPQFLKLNFKDGRIYVGVGHQRRFGDGDDVLVRAEEHLPDLSGSEELWSG